MKPGNLKRALAKIHHFDGRQWCGCFTPAEIIALIDAGARPVESNQWVLEHTKNKIKIGDCTPIWFYFYKSEPFPR